MNIPTVPANKVPLTSHMFQLPSNEERAKLEAWRLLQDKNIDPESAVLRTDKNGAWYLHFNTKEGEG